MVLRRLKQNGIKLRAEKCVFLKQELKYLDKIISEKGYRTILVKLKLLQNLNKILRTLASYENFWDFLTIIVHQSVIFREKQNLFMIYSPNQKKK